MRDVYIVGVSQAPVNRNADLRGRHLAAGVVRNAMSDAGIEAPEIDALYVGNMTAGVLGQQQQLGSLIADYSGLSGIEAVTTEAACASGAAAARMGWQTIAGGINDVVVICGMERMTHADTDSVTQALATAADRELESSRGETFLSLNARLMRAYMEKFRVQAEDFAHFSINAHGNALSNAHAVFHKAIDADDHMRSRIIVDPIRLLDVSPICNGSAAVILGSEQVMRRLKPNGAARVCVTASSAATAPLALERRADLLRLEAVEISTKQAFLNAGIGHKDVDFFELHDAYTIMSVLCLESAGFAPPGTATAFGQEGRIRLDGDLPISTMGGLKARGHPVGATGVYQMVEAYLQLAEQAGNNQIKNPQVALIQNIGGTASTVVNHVLRRVD